MKLPQITRAYGVVLGHLCATCLKFDLEQVSDTVGGVQRA